MRVIVFFMIPLLAGCSVFRQHPKYEFADGTYSSHMMGEKHGKVYVDNDGDNILVYPLIKSENGYVIDTSVHKPLLFAMDSPPAPGVKPSFSRNSFDIDFLTIPFKYRFPVNDFPHQFNTNLNGAVYFGHRTDIYVIRYPSNLLKKSSKQTAHFGFSFGAFTGLGGTAMNPSVTNNQITVEYDGVVWSKGVSGIIGLNSFTTGVAVGWDHLLDNNKSGWIYQGKPWIGFVFGLNLN